MSGEYFCIEEVDPANYNYEDYGTKSKVPKSRERSRHPKSREHDAKSTSSKKSQDLILYEIEEQLKVAENRCNTLKGHIHSMKKIYQSTGKNEPLPHQKKSQIMYEQKKMAAEETFKRKIARKRSKSPPNVKSRSRTPSKRHYPTAEVQDSSDAIPHQSSSSSTNLHHHKQVNQHMRKADFAPPMIRQNSPSIGTDHSGAATRTMNSILTGIADSVNRITQIPCNPKEPIKMKKQETEFVDQFTEIGSSLQISGRLSPRVEKRILEQKRKVDEVLKIKKLPVEVHTMESWNPPKVSATSMKSKTAKTAWSRHTRSKTPCKKTKIQFSSASVNITKPNKSSARHIENTTKLRPMGNTTLEESPSLIIKRKRKRALKRLHPNSSKYETRKLDQNPGLLEHANVSTNLIELYHNVAAKTSDSDESNHYGHRSHAARQKGGGDLPLTSAQIVPSRDNTEMRATSPTTKTVNKIFSPARVLTPINEHVYVKRIHTNATDCLSNMTRNYELPTIASKLKQVAKSYLSSFNFRKIPFCVAKSTTPSHNIGVNIQQVMSIMKTKQPVVGLSPTLAHNIGLAAGKFHDNPLSALVSTLSTKMAYRQSHCPLSLKTNVNYCQLQEMAKTIEEEPYEERPGCVAEDSTEAVTDNVNAKPANEIKEIKVSRLRQLSQSLQEVSQQEPIEPPEWTVDPTHAEQCTCASQKGVPFHEILNKYHVSSECIKGMKPSHVFKTNVPQQRPCRSAYGTATQKNRTKNWVNATSQPPAPPVTAVVQPVQPKSESGDLQGKERNLKTVLTNLYEEFDSLNNKYEGLSKDINKNNTEASELTLKELEQMENMLGKKEEEINMVMSLYTEVLALKDQVKKLREKASQSAFTINSNSNQQVKVSEYKEPSTAAHLTQLLRQIQNYQIHCKSKVN